jgi:hypothetical protein
MLLKPFCHPALGLLGRLQDAFKLSDVHLFG